MKTKAYQLKHIWRTVKERKRRQAKQKALLLRIKEDQEREEREFKRRIKAFRVYGGGRVGATV